MATALVEDGSSDRGVDVPPLRSCVNVGAADGTRNSASALAVLPPFMLSIDRPSMQYGLFVSAAVRRAMLLVVGRHETDSPPIRGSCRLLCIAQQIRAIARSSKAPIPPATAIGRIGREELPLSARGLTMAVVAGAEGAASGCTTGGGGGRIIMGSDGEGGGGGCGGCGGEGAE